MRPNNNLRIEVYVSAATIRWLKSEAERLTVAQGGRVKPHGKGGKGVVKVGAVVESLVNAENERRKAGEPCAA